MANLHNDVLDAALNVIAAHATHLYICDQVPVTYAEASSTYALGVKASPSIGAPGARSPSGRKITVAAITDGEVTVTDADCDAWALVDSGDSRLLAAGALAAGQAVTDGNVFTLAAFDIGIPAPA